MTGRAIINLITHVCDNLDTDIPLGIIVRNPSGEVISTIPVANYYITATGKLRIEAKDIPDFMVP